MVLFWSILAFSVIGFLIHVFRTKPKGKGRLVELFLLYQLIFNVGLLSLLAFIGLMFMPERVANSLGWNRCPFQEELANVNLAFAVLGFMCIRFRGNFWLATIIGISIWLIGDGIGHLAEAISTQNYSANNLSMMFTDIFIPILLLVLLGLHIKFNRPILERS